MTARKTPKPTTLADIEAKWPIRAAIAVALGWADPLVGTQCQMLHKYGLEIEQKLVPVVQACVRRWQYVMPNGAKCCWKGLATHWDSLNGTGGKQPADFRPKLGPDCHHCKAHGRLCRSVEWSPSKFMCPHCEQCWTYKKPETNGG